MSDHYIPDRNNAHLDTSEFEEAMLDYYRTNPVASEPNEILRHLFEEVRSRVTCTPTQPDDYAIVCRYLTPQKFVSFVTSKRIFFPTADLFQDTGECRPPIDFENSILRITSKMPEFDQNGLMASLFLEKEIIAEQKRWHISCWTMLERHYDDHLLFQHHGGPHGIGITANFGRLKETIKEQQSNTVQIVTGKVSYGSISGAFHMRKRAIFEGENEVRFSISRKAGDQSTVSLCEPMSIDISEIFPEIGLRFRPDATPAELRDYRTLLETFGGDPENYQHVTGYS